MRKLKFITGAASLVVALAVGYAGYAQMSDHLKNDKYVFEYETTTVMEIVEKSANDVNVLMAKQLDAKNIIIEVETNAPISTEATKTFTKADDEVNTQKETESLKSKKSSKNKDKKKNGKLKNMGTYKVTAYCSCSRCCGKSNGITASGKKAKEGRTIAADTSVLPFGTKVVIDGNTYTVEDRGGAIRGKRIDVFFSSHKKALKWGVKYLKVYVKK